MVAEDCILGALYWVEEVVMGEIGDVFDGLSDPRRVNGQQHSLHDILVIALCTLLCGGATCTDMALFGRAKREFLESFLKLERGIPSHDTFSRVFRLLDPEEFHTWFRGFMRQFAQGCRGVVALDGKTLRRSYDRAEGASPLHLVSMPGPPSSGWLWDNWPWRVNPMRSPPYRSS